MNKLKLYGRPDTPDIYVVRDFLRRSVVDYDWFDIDLIPAEELPLHNHNLTTATSLIEFPDGQLVCNPTTEEIARHLGWIKKPTYSEYDLSIYGAGPAGLSAAVYAGSEGLKTILIEKEAIGGQAGTSSLIENYMGFPNGIAGAELAERTRQQALKFGVEILLIQEGIKGSFENNKIHVDLKNGDKLVAKSNICATGIDYARLNIPEEDHFFRRGLYYGAGASEACFCRGKDVFIIGSGNSAGQAASHFSGFARTVYMIVRKDNLAETLSDYLVKRICNIPNVKILFNSQVTELQGDDLLRHIKVENTKDNTETWYESSKLFVCIGGQPNTHWAEETSIIRDSKGYLVTGSDLFNQEAFAGCWPLERNPFYLETSVPGSFAAGDVRFNSVKRVASAAGEGAMAVSQVHKYLTEL